MGHEPDGSALSKDTGLAYDWEQSADGLTWTFLIREGVKFHDGTEATAEDVKFSLERAASPGSSASDARNLKNWVDTVTVLDPYTVAVKTKVVIPLLPYELSTFSAVGAAIQPKAYIEKVGEAEFNANPISTGPYLIEEHLIGDHITFKAISGEHFAVGVPKYERIIFKLVPEESSRIAMLKRSDVDVATVSLERALELKDDGFPVWEKPGDRTYGVIFQQLWDESPTQDIRVREALGLAINKEEILTYLFKGKGMLQGSYPSTSATLGHGENTPALPYDPVRAKELLAEAGYPDGFTLNLYATTLYPGHVEYNEALASYWSAIGIDVKVLVMDYAGFRVKLQEGSLENPALRGHGYPSLAIVGVWLSWFNSDGINTGLHDPEYDKLYDDLLSVKTAEEFYNAQRILEEWLYNNRITIGCFETSSFVVTSSTLTDWEATLAPYNFGVLASIYTK